MEIIMMKQILEVNENIANANKEYFYTNNILCVNVLGSPGSGKTTLISALAKKLDGIKVGVIEGDVASSIDTQRLINEGVAAVQINTGGGCHLDAISINEAARALNLQNAILFIENVGNLICTAEFDLGEHIKLLAASVAEGDDKPFKYIPMFSCVDTVALTKSDIAEAVSFDRANFIKGLRLVSEAKLFDVSCKQDYGVEAIADYLIKFKFDLHALRVEI
jgi:hydrogenase nickel incorporation protein HypB